jgi:hypothetical protein
MYAVQKDNHSKPGQPHVEPNCYSTDPLERAGDGLKLVGDVLEETAPPPEGC